ncbi:unnamed protein product [Auanema sp. JU1783]|nr:unnamed protein product [Auanema sp. JU1783]
MVTGTIELSSQHHIRCIYIEEFGKEIQIWGTIREYCWTCDFRKTFGSQINSVLEKKRHRTVWTAYSKFTLCQLAQACFKRRKRVRKKGLDKASTFCNGLSTYTTTIREKKVNFNV